MGTDAALTPYHVDRSKLFILERFGGKLLMSADANEIASYIEMTRFPIPDDEIHKDTKGYGVGAGSGLNRAAQVTLVICAKFQDFSTSLRKQAPMLQSATKTRKTCGRITQSFTGMWYIPIFRTG